MSDRDSRLQQFFSGYFNQDWDASGAATWKEVVDEFVAQNPNEVVRGVSADILSWMSDDKGGLPPSFGCDYNPRADGLDERTWVRLLAEYMGRRLEVD